MNQKDNPHITRKLTFQPELHRLVRSGLNPTGVKCVTRRMSAQCQVGDVVAMTTGWATNAWDDHIKPVDLTIDEPFIWVWQPDGIGVVKGKTRQARFFPRRMYQACPLAIITDVRQEPVQAIDEDDAILEGMQPTDEQRKHAWSPHYDAFASTWVRLHGIESWEKNDLVTRIAWEPITDAEARARWERGIKLNRSRSMTTKPDKPGWYYATDGDKSGLAKVLRMRDGELRALCTYEAHEYNTLPIQNTKVNFIEPVPTLDQVREMRAQVEFLEWMGEELNFRGRITFEYCHGSTGILLNPSGKRIVAWPGQLRDGWRHWDAIKEAVR